MMLEITEDPLTNFFDGIRNPLTRDRYEKRLRLFFQYIGIEGSDLTEQGERFASRAKADPRWAAQIIIAYLKHQKSRVEEKKISASTLPNYLKPIKLFCDMNDILLNWKKIRKLLPSARRYADDRIPTPDEIRVIISYPDRRVKPAVLTMASSGIRIGAWDYLKWGHITPIEMDGQVVAAKLRIYVGTDEEYYTFISPEAYNAINRYMKYRALCGEKITHDSPVIRDLFKDDRGGKGEAHLPKRLKSTGIKRMIEDALWSSKVRTPLEEGEKRHPFQADHGFRKFFKSVCERHFKSLHVEMLLGHDTGLNQSYYRPQENELLEDYLKAIPDLTIIERVPQLPVEDINELKRRVKELEEWRGKEVISMVMFFKHLANLPVKEIGPLAERSLNEILESLPEDVKQKLVGHLK